MKVAIQILSTNSEPSLSNIDAIKNTYILLANELKAAGKLKHSYDFFFYRGIGNSNEISNDTLVSNINGYDNVYNVDIDLRESIYNTFEKGIEMLKVSNSYGPYDWIIRCNISCYINIPLLDSVLIGMDKTKVYCNAINSYINDEQYYNDLYPRGDFMMLSNTLVQGILDKSDTYIRCDYKVKDRINIPHVDDCLFGLCLIDLLGSKYYKSYQMVQYNFLPESSDTLISDYKINCLTSRVKTLAPGVNYSGYSWEDNEYRRYDGKKMYLLTNEIRNKDYSKLSISLVSLLTNNRNTIAVALKAASIADMHKILQEKRG